MAKNVLTFNYKSPRAFDQIPSAVQRITANRQCTVHWQHFTISWRRHWIQIICRRKWWATIGLRVQIFAIIITEIQQFAGSVRVSTLRIRLGHVFLLIIVPGLFRLIAIVLGARVTWFTYRGHANNRFNSIVAQWGQCAQFRCRMGKECIRCIGAQLEVRFLQQILFALHFTGDRRRGHYLRWIWILGAENGGRRGFLG